MMHYGYLPSKKLTSQIREISVLPLCYQENVPLIKSKSQAEYGKEWCRLRDLNSRPTDYKSVALPTELKRQHEHIYIIFLKFQLNFEVVHMVIHLDFVQSDLLH